MEKENLILIFVAIARHIAKIRNGLWNMEKDEKNLGWYERALQEAQKVRSEFLKQNSEYLMELTKKLKKRLVDKTKLPIIL
ncbi:hypothetical protein RIR_jg20632.t1 [Rhizophagus irregularis DAOM 181602=DAOM 197198]|uniref:Uncharacterized protein n=1 Tax=Rhizophagus irregularis (strain DAOM 181602 / DAOM 197198 / MUCL 43194) TaxID=747089 RepID=U9TZQ4_RHIID|nr:hypothetical protein RIR_jg20632.t1 [Rhizophagus irregularis DAOM 181602=DAOM 197198]